MWVCACKYVLKNPKEKKQNKTNGLKIVILVHKRNYSTEELRKLLQATKNKYEREQLNTDRLLQIYK